jgi:hypothetical protein
MFRNKPPQKQFKISLGFQPNCYGTMADDFHDDFQSGATGDASHMPFEAVLREILERIADTFANGEILEQRSIKGHCAGFVSLLLISEANEEKISGIPKVLNPLRSPGACPLN